MLNDKSRITSILKANILDSSITGIPTFTPSCLDLDDNFSFTITANLRLGHLVEKVISAMFQGSKNYEVLHENVQIKDNQQTIGEIDFILQETSSNAITHLEVAYKFYLYDPCISNNQNLNWIGPNRNDSLVEKLTKLKDKQFPLLLHPNAQTTLKNIDVNNASQALCFMIALFVPYNFKETLKPEFEAAIKGYYLRLDTFNSLNHTSMKYCLPLKTNWGIDPPENDSWMDFTEIKEYLATAIREKQAPLCWRKHGDHYSTFFIVWW